MRKNNLRQAFLNRTSQLQSFTKRAIVAHYGVSEEEFDQLVAEGFIVASEDIICVKCYRKQQEETETCIYCGCEDFVREEGFFKYSEKEVIAK